MSNPLDAIGAVATAAAKGLDLAKVREERMNAPAMVDNAKAKTDAQIKDDATAAVAANDLDEVRKQAAE